MKLAIKGHPERGKEVLQLLEMFGGKAKKTWLGTDKESAYFIDTKGKVDNFPLANCANQKIYKIFTLEEFEQLYPYKIGDKVCSDNCLFYDDDGLYTISNPFEIIRMEWNAALDTITCEIKKHHTILVTTVETIKPYNIMKTKVKELKDYLKPGYVVEYEEGNKYVITQDVHGNMFGIQLGEALLWSSLTSLDSITKVYQINKPGCLHKIYSKDYLTLVWERKEVELTMQQIADKFGINVDQIRIKK